MDPLQPDPLLKPDAFIDPNPISNGGGTFTPEPEPETTSVPPLADNQTPAEASQPSDQVPGSAQMDWLPLGWTVVERVRASGASAGTKDKYYLDPNTKRRFRSKKEVLSHLGISDPTPPRRKKNAASDADTATPQANSQTAEKKRRKKQPEVKAQDLVKRFNFDDVPAKVKWELTNIYEGSWQPLLNSADEVTVPSRQEWAAAFTYLTIPNEESVLL